MKAESTSSSLLSDVNLRIGGPQTSAASDDVKSHGSPVSLGSIIHCPTTLLNIDLAIHCSVFLRCSEHVKLIVPLIQVSISDLCIILTDPFLSKVTFVE